jgi:hypothetical protein
MGFLESLSATQIPIDCVSILNSITTRNLSHWACFFSLFRIIDRMGGLPTYPGPSGRDRPLPIPTSASLSPTWRNMVSGDARFPRPSLARGSVPEVTLRGSGLRHPPGAGPYRRLSMSARDSSNVAGFPRGSAAASVHVFALMDELHDRKRNSGAQNTNRAVTTVMAKIPQLNQKSKT